GFSSEYRPERGANAAYQTLHHPDTPAYGDAGTAWAAILKNGTIEYVAESFEIPMRATGVVVRESDENGFVTRVDLLDTSDIFHTVWTGSDPSAPGSVVNLLLSFPSTSYAVKGVRVWVNTDPDPNEWEEIDAIALRGTPSDGTAPTLAFTAPHVGATIKTLPAITGSAADETGGSGLLRVRVRLRRAVDGTPISGEYWTGAGWSATSAYLAVSGTTSWRVDTAKTPLPVGPDLPDGRYVIYATVYDKSHNARTVINTITVDGTAPASLAITNPAGATVSRLTALAGTARDTSGGSGIARVIVRILQRNDTSTTADDRWWGYDSATRTWGWRSAAYNLATASTATAPNPPFATWKVTSLLPGALPSGAYVLYAYAYDRDGNYKVVARAIT
ncbi:MAG: hypothetical protein C4321_03655, partial [Chloroflexota bacterium]